MPHGVFVCAEVSVSDSEGDTFAGASCRACFVSIALRFKVVM